MTDAKPTLNWDEFTITVQGTDASFSLKDFDDDPIKAMADWGHVLAEAEREQAQVEVTYRSWRAEMTTQLLAQDGKLAEWKVRASVEDHPNFRAFKEAQAQALRNVTLAECTYEAFKAKAALTAASS